MEAHDQAITKALAGSGPRLTFAALAFVCTLIFATVLKHVYSSSVDLAHHYALIHWLFEHWTVHSNSAIVLGEMAVYPRYSHVAAAVLARFVGSPFLAMQILASIALVAAWASLSLLPRLVPQGVSWFLTLTLIVLLALNHYAFGLEVFGQELVGNYFFSQLIAQGIFLVVLVTATYLEFRHGFSVLVPVGVIVASIALEGVHLLPAVEGAAYALLLLFVRAASERGRILSRGTVLLLVSIVAALALYKHPAFAASRDISENNGALSLTLLNSLPRLVGLSLLTALVSLSLLVASLPASRTYSRMATACRHFGCAGAAITALFLLQVIAFKLGYGSEYAYRKYGFGLATFLLVNLALFITQICTGRRKADTHDTAAARLGWLQPAAVLLALWAFTFVGSPISANTASILATEAAATTAKQMGALEGANLPYARGLMIGNMGNIPDYLVTIGIFETVRDGNAFATLRNIDFPNPERVGSIFTSALGPTVWSSPACVRTRLPGSYVITDGHCVMAKFTKVCQAAADFSSSGFLVSSMLTGFDGPERSGRWTDAQRASFSCTVEGVRPHKAKLTFVPFSPGGRAQTVNVSINGIAAARSRTNQSTTLIMDIPGDATPAGATLRFDLDLPEAISPHDAGVNPDRRTLGVMVSRIELD